MAKLTIVHSNVSPSNQLEVHKRDCQDTRKYRRTDTYHESHDDLESLVTEWWADQIAESDGDWAEWESYVSEFRFMPCSPLQA